MKEKKFLKSFGEIDENIVKEATPKKYKEGGTKQGGSEKWRKWLPAVACAYLLISSVGFAIWFNQSQRTQEPDSEEQVLQHTELTTLEELETKVAAEGKPENEQDELTVETAEGIPETGRNEIATEIDDSEDGETGMIDIGLEEMENLSEANYFIYNGEGKYTIYKEQKVSPDMMLQDVIKRYLDLNQISNVTCMSSDESFKDSYTTTDGEVVTHYPKAYFYRVDLVGTTFSEEYAIGLINTIARSMDTSGICYVKINLGGEPLLLSEPMPEDGYTYIYVETIDVESEPIVENAEEMIDVSFIITDRYGDPVSNIAYHIAYVSGEKGSYQPGYGITDSTGNFTRKLHPNATYTIYMEKQNAVSYTDEITPVIYERLTETFEITESGTKKLIWDGASIISERKNPVTITVPEAFDGSYENLFIQLFTESGGQVQLGYAESDGTFVWNDATDGTYQLNIQKFNKENEADEILYNKSYSVEVKEGKMTILAEQTEPITIPE